MKIIGIHDGHNASACLLQDGKIKFAIQEERLTRVKNWSGFPKESILWILKMAKLKPEEIDFVVFSNDHTATPCGTRDELLNIYKNAYKFSGRITRLIRYSPLMNIYKSKKKNTRLKDIMSLGFNKEKISFMDHHSCHSAAAYFGNGDLNRDILIFTCDGSGDELSASISIGKEGKITKIASIHEDESIGNIFAVVTFMMGMVPLEHEYKMMGMAPYADERGVERVYKKLISCFEFDEKNPLVWKRKNGMPPTFNSYKFLFKMFEFERFDGVMGGVQKFCEVMLTRWVANAIAKTKIKNIVLSGGVFMNVKANKAIMELPEVETLFVFPSCGDETNPIGACYSRYAEKKNYKEIEPIGDIYWGPEYSNEEVENRLKKYNFTNCKIEYKYYENIENEVAQMLAKGEVVARFSGREEFGARSLGNRAILANPSKQHLIKEINEMIKARDFWMPFACSINEEYEEKYVINPKKVAAPYMILSYDTTDKVDEIYAGTHPYDKTVRPQIVYKKHNPKYHKLINEFEKITGIGGVLNTSFNLHGFPIVSSPEDAFEVLDKSGLNFLAVENYIIKKV